MNAVQGAGNSVGVFSWYSLGSLVLNEHYLNSTAYHVHPLMTPDHQCISQISDHKSNFFEFTALKWPRYLPDFNPVKHLWDVMELEMDQNL